MTDGDKQGIDIGMEYLKGIYTNTDIETKEAQPIYILHRDTIKTFLHEKIESLGLTARLLGYVGIEITIAASLKTASFNDWLGIKGNVIEGVFIAFLLITAVLIFRDGKCWWESKDKLTVDNLADDLGARGSVIKPSNKDGHS